MTTYSNIEFFLDGKSMERLDSLCIDFTAATPLPQPLAPLPDRCTAKGVTQLTPAGRAFFKRLSRSDASARYAERACQRWGHRWHNVDPHDPYKAECTRCGMWARSAPLEPL